MSVVRVLLAGLAASLALLAVSAGTASAAVWAEQGDAGQTRATAQEPTVSPVTQITGAVGTDPDLYKLTLPVGGFTAITATVSDPILSLFREDGTLLLQNDDFFGLQSCISASLQPGIYYLGITRYSNFPSHADSMGTNSSGFNYAINISQDEQCTNPDHDGDGDLNAADNCPFDYNPDQADTDGDGAGDACDTTVDTDGDGDPDDADNCPTVSNEDQADQDVDGEGDACDTDIDGDGDLNDADNCPTTVNADQADTDGDGTGDACDSLTYNWSGFFRPVDNKDANGDYILNRVKAGSAVPVKFSLGGDQGMDVFQEGYPTSHVTECDSQADSDSVEETVNAGGSSLTYDSLTDTYTYVWKTVKSWSRCRQLVVRTADGGQHRANFQFTK